MFTIGCAVHQYLSYCIISWEELGKDKNPASSCGPHHRGCVFLSLLVSGLLGLNLLDALSPIIAERAQGWGADVTWSAGLAGKLCGTIAGLPWPQETRREGGKRCGGGGGRPEDSAGAEGGWVRWLQGFSTVVGGELRGGGITMRVGRSSWIDIRES